MKRFAILFLSILLSLQLFAQDGSINPYNKRWSLKAGVGYFGSPMGTHNGFSAWWAAAYSLPSRLEFHARLDYSTANDKFTPEEIERLWPSGSNQWMGFHDGDRRVHDYYLFEVGVSYPFIMGGRHRIAPGLGVLFLGERRWEPTHRTAVEIDEGGFSRYYGEIIGSRFYDGGGGDLRFSFQLEYSFHFHNGFFVGLCGHGFYDFTSIDGISISPLIGVRF